MASLSCIFITTNTGDNLSSMPLWKVRHRLEGGKRKKEEEKKQYDLDERVEEIREEVVRKFSSTSSLKF